MHTQESRNHAVTTFAAFDHVFCDTMGPKFCSKQTMFDKVTVKKLKIQMDPSLRTRAWLPSVLILRGLWLLHSAYLVPFYTELYSISTVSVCTVHDMVINATKQWGNVDKKWKNFALRRVVLPITGDLSVRKKCEHVLRIWQAGAQDCTQSVTPIASYWCNALRRRIASMS